MSMEQITEDQIVKIYEYFKPLHRVRFGDWLSEMRRQVVIQLESQGASIPSIAKIINVERSTVYNYIKCTPRKDCMKEVDKFLFEWIEKGMYPKSKYFNNSKKGIYYLDYELRTIDNIYLPIERSSRYGKRKPIVQLDKFIDEL